MKGQLASLVQRLWQLTPSNGGLEPIITFPASGAAQLAGWPRTASTESRTAGAVALAVRFAVDAITTYPPTNSRARASRANRVERRCPTLTSKEEGTARRVPQAFCTRAAVDE